MRVGVQLCVRERSHARVHVCTFKGACDVVASSSLFVRVRMHHETSALA